MQSSKFYEDIDLTLPDNIYIGLNKASREYEMTINDIYYFILNGGKYGSAFYDEVFGEAFDNYQKYSGKKDIISNDFVMPEIKARYDIDDTDIISNYWNVSFDGSHICHITNIEVKPDNQKVIYDEIADDKWLDGICNVHSKVAIYDDIIAKLATAVFTSTSDAVREEYKKIRNARLELSTLEDENRGKFATEVINPLMEGKDASKCSWVLNPVEKTLRITETID